jgi:hypothetical protein
MFWETTAAGAFSETRADGSMVGARTEIIALQQSWLWFAGVHGIEPQHCALCWSGVIADMQSANNKTNKAPAASAENSLLFIILVLL